MLSLLARLAIIALLVYVGVTFWYGRTEKTLQNLVPAEKKETQTQSGPKPETDRKTEQIDPQVILTRNIFKAVVETGEHPAGDLEKDLEALAETSMKLVLLGTVSGSREDARAIIRDETAKKEDIFQVGSDVQGALITRIERGRVVLQVNGREEILNIKDPEGGGPQGGGHQGGGQPMGMPSPMPPPMPPAAETPAAQAGQPEGIDDRKVPEALPRRRINFRNPAPAPVGGGMVSPQPIVEAEEPPDMTEAEAPVQGDQEPVEEAPPVNE